MHKLLRNKQDEKIEFTNEKGHFYSNVRSFRKSDFLSGLQKDQQEIQQMRISDKISPKEDIRKKK